MRRQGPFSWSDVTVLEAVAHATQLNARHTENEGKRAKMLEVADHLLEIAAVITKILTPTKWGAK